MNLQVQPHSFGWSNTLRSEQNTTRTIPMVWNAVYAYELNPCISRSRVCWKFMNRNIWGITSIITADAVNCASDTIFPPFFLFARWPCCTSSDIFSSIVAPSPPGDVRPNQSTQQSQLKICRPFWSRGTWFWRYLEFESREKMSFGGNFFFVRKKDIFINHFGAFNSISQFRFISTLSPSMIVIRWHFWPLEAPQEF